MKSDKSISKSKSDASSANSYNAFTFWLLCHVRAICMGFGAVVKQPMTSLLSILVIGIALSLPLGLFVLLNNAKVMTHEMYASPTLSLYLKKSTSQSDIDTLITSLQQRPDVATVKFISAEQGLEDFAKQSDLDNIVTALDSNPIPAVLQITPKKDYEEPDYLASLQEETSRWENVDVSQLDLDWVTRLYQLIHLLQRLIYSITFIFSLGVFLIIGNTIRMVAESHREEIEVLSLFGATSSFIRRPIIYRGVIYGFVGGLLSCLTVDVVCWWLHTPAELLLQSYAVTRSFFLVGVGWSLAVCCVSGFLGYLGARFAIR